MRHHRKKIPGKIRDNMQYSAKNRRYNLMVVEAKEKEKESWNPLFTGAKNMTKAQKTENRKEESLQYDL